MALMAAAIVLYHCHPNLHSLRFSGVAAVLVSVRVCMVCFVKHALLASDFTFRQWHEGAHCIAGSGAASEQAAATLHYVNQCRLRQRRQPACIMPLSPAHACGLMLMSAVGPQGVKQHEDVQTTGGRQTAG
jgi:hypothetical protein